jgi:hypothetical protein
VTGILTENIGPDRRLSQLVWDNPEIETPHHAELCHEN